MSGPVPSSSATMPIPVGLAPYTEQSTTILLPSDNSAFLNPVQQFNRDLSVAVISSWGKLWQEEQEIEYRKSEEKKSKAKAKKLEAKGGKAKRAADQETQEDERAAKRERLEFASIASEAQPHNLSSEPSMEATQPLSSSSASSTPPPNHSFTPQEFVILEALSATGLRAIRYAKEISGCKYVIANDFSPTAVEAMRRNVEYNSQGPSVERVSTGYLSKKDREEPWKGKVRVNEGDALALMYSHRSERVHCIDLDPYGTAAPFLDSAVQATEDGGLMAITCTDLAVLAGSNYPEKCFSNYGGVSGRAHYSHEFALRLLLSSLSSIAGRYGRYIVPMISLSIDFYIRVFVRVYTNAIEVKKAFSKTGVTYVCNGCQAFALQPFGKVVQVQGKGPNINTSHKNMAGPSIGPHCEHCGSAHHVVGPMWLGPLHDPAFCGRVLEHIDQNEDKFGTVARMKGMVTLAKEEIETHFYFEPSMLAGIFRCACPSLNDIGSAILNGGYQVSRAHAGAGALKTDAPISFIHDIFRHFIATRAPITASNIKAGSPAATLTSTPLTHTIDFTPHKDVGTAISRVKLVRYQENPTANWGPAPRARNSKTEEGQEGDGDGVKKRGGKDKIANQGKRKEKRKAAAAAAAVPEEHAMAKGAAAAVELSAAAAGFGEPVIQPATLTSTSTESSVVDEEEDAMNN